MAHLPDEPRARPRRSLSRAGALLCGLLSLPLLESSATLNAQAPASRSEDGVWESVDERLIPRVGARLIVPRSYRTVRVNKDALDQILARAPQELALAAGISDAVLTLPMPDGTFARFRIEESPILAPQVAAEFPEIKTYRGQGLDDATLTARLGWTAAGFHAIVLGADTTVYIDPYATGDTVHYLTYDKRDAERPEGAEPFRCQVDGSDARPTVRALPIATGATLRTYRLALAVTAEYTGAAGSATLAMSRMTATLNRVNGIFERDLAVRTTLVSGSSLIYTNAGTDPYTNNDGAAMLSQNQATIDSVIGTANYDIGHVFSTGGGSVATLRSTCAAAFKARGVTGASSPVGDAFDVDYVAHEMGHQFGANHPFNGTSAKCGGNRSAAHAYEPGSGSTIMAYAGICGAENLQANSNDYFHVESLNEIDSYLTSPSEGASCGTVTATGNTLPNVTTSTSVTTPARTPFTLTATASDANGDSLTYDWEEYDLGASTSTATTVDDGSRPIFRSYAASTSASRTFPSLQYVLSNSNAPPATYTCGSSTCLVGETLPTTSRTMTVRVTVRDNRAGGGGVRSATTTVSVASGSGPFAVTSPNSAVSVAGLSSQTVTWSVTNTSSAPVSAANVRILLSTDGGTTFATVLASSTPNDGSETVVMPNSPTAMARIKVEAVDNIFFDVSDANFTINAVASSTLTVTKQGTGSGAITSVPGGINCGSDCFKSYASGTSVTLTATADTGSWFTGWSGGSCSGTGPCTLTLSTNVTVTATFSSTSGTSQAGGGIVDRLAAIVDLNGDGRGDSFRYNPSTGTWTIDTEAAARAADDSRGPRTLTPQTSSTWSPSWIVKAADFNGDGRTDLFLYNEATGQWFKAINNGALNFTYFSSTWSPGWTVGIVDLNGDGKSDVFLYNPTSGRWFRCTSSGDGTGEFAYVADTWSPNWQVHPVDLDADRLTDFFLYNSSTGQWFRATNDGVSGFSYTSGTWSADWSITSGDFNGDRLSDLFLYNRTTGVWFVAMNTGASFSYTTEMWSASWTISRGDFNGDGRTDLFLYNASTGTWFECFSDGAGGFRYASASWSPAWDVRVTEFNLDARADILLYNGTTGQFFEVTNTGTGTFSYSSGTWGAGLTIVVNR